METIHNILSGAQISGSRAGLCQDVSQQIKTILSDNGFTTYLLNSGQHRKVLADSNGHKYIIDGAPLDNSQKIVIEPVTQYQDFGSMPVINTVVYIKIP